MSWINGSEIDGGTVMSEDNNPSLRFIPAYRLDLGVEPVKIFRMSLSMEMNVPSFDMVEIIESHTHGLELLVEDVGMQSAAQDGHVVVNIEAGPVKEDKSAQFPVLVALLADILFKEVDSAFHLSPAGVVRFVIAEEEEDDLELGELLFEKVKDSCVLEGSYVT